MNSSIPIKSQVKAFLDIPTVSTIRKFLNPN